MGQGMHLSWNVCLGALVILQQSRESPPPHVEVNVPFGCCQVFSEQLSGFLREILSFESRFITANFAERCFFDDVLSFVKDSTQPKGKLKLEPWLLPATLWYLCVSLFLFVGWVLEQM